MELVETNGKQDEEVSMRAGDRILLLVLGLAVIMFAICEVIDVVKARSDYDDTIVIVTSDNGYHVGEKDHFEKSTLWEIAARTPMAVPLAGGQHAGKS